MPDTAEYADPYTERIAAQRQLLQNLADQKARYSPEEIATRRGANDRTHDLALLSMLSGSRTLAPVGEMLFKQAASDRAQRVSDQGSYDPISGEFAYHPEVQRERQERELARIEDAQAAGQRAWQMARQAAQEKQAEAQRHREFLGIQNDLTRAATGNARAAAQEARNWTAEDRMSDDFNRDTKTAGTVLNAHKQLQAIAQANNAPSDVAFIYSYMKMLDPASVVREGEFATAQNAAGIPDRIRNAYNASLSGQRLNPQQRAEMLGTAGRLADVAQRSIADSADMYGERATRRNLNPENVTGSPYVPRVLKKAASGRDAPAGPAPVRVTY